MKKLINLSLIILISLIFCMSSSLEERNIASNEVSNDDTIIPPPTLISPQYFSDFACSTASLRVISPQSSFFDATMPCTFIWSSCGKNISYELMISTNKDFFEAESIMSQDTVFTKSFNNIISGTFFWKVRAIRTKTNYSNWSRIKYFEIEQFMEIIPSGCHGNCGSCSHPCSKLSQFRYNKN